MKNILISLIVLWYSFGQCHSGSLPAGQQAEQTLITTLLTGYRKDIRPDQQVTVGITANLQQIVSIDDKQQIMTSSSFISQTWFDERLSWTPSSNNDIQVIMLSVKSLWIPDTMILNSADSSGYFTISDYSYASVYYTGQVYMILPALAVKTRCYMYVRNFPFDKQVCSINITSWSQGSNRILYTEASDSVLDLSQYSEHPVWYLNDTDIILVEAGDRVPYENTSNDIISIQLYLHRKPAYFIVNGIYACWILNCVTLLAYALPFSTQISLCMVCFMTFSVYTVTFSNLFPQQSEYLMLITLYFLLSIGWTALSMFWFLVCNYYQTKNEMPELLRKFCAFLQERIFCCCFPPPKDDDKKGKKKDGTDSKGGTDTQNTKCGCCQTWFTSCCRKRNINEDNNKNSHVVIESVEVTLTNLARTNSNAEDESPKPKCHFCDRCETCQADYDKDKTKNKTKKDIESKCNALNSVVFIFVFIFMLISNMVIFISMGK